MVDDKKRVEFTSEMKKNYKILFPNMAEIHFLFLKNVFLSYGYDIDVLTNTGHNIIDEGLKYVHNDTCYPALLTIGQMISALKSGKYDVDHTALIMSQTGGGCRASNYIHLLRKALKNAGFPQVPVISVNPAGMEKNSGFKITIPILRRALAAITYADLLMLLKNQTKPYELVNGETESLVKYWVDYISAKFSQKEAITKKAIKEYLSQIVSSFEKIKIRDEKKVKVGIVGEIYVKYSPLANNHLEDFLFEQNCEVNVPGLLEFLLFVTDNNVEDIKIYGGSRIKKFIYSSTFRFLEQFETALISSLSNTKRYIVPSSYLHIKELVTPLIGHGCKMGEGWLLTGEIMELIEHGYDNIVCAQPFGCLPNHIVGKGMIRSIKNLHPNSNIIAIDYDASATKVNQENRIKLMLSVARENLSDSVRERVVI